MFAIFASAARTWRIRRIALTIPALWTAILAVSLTVNIVLERQTTIDLSRTEARAAYNKDLLYRRWASQRGGIYVPITDQTPPNPYLNVPERDIQTPSGRALTLVNPAYMTRQVYELDLQQSGVRGHITSLKPLRPENASDAWEAAALQAFENGATEVSEETLLDGEPYLRLMRPMYIEQSCLKCHAQQGYQVGDVRGGISVAVPLTPYFTAMHNRNLLFVAGYGVIWLLGMIGIFLSAHFLQKRATAYDQVVAALRASEEKFFKAFHYAPLLMTLSALEDGTYLEVNEKFLQVSGFSRAEVLGKTSVEIGWISAEDRTRLVALMRAHGRVTDLELCLHTKDRRTIICLYQGELMTIGDRPRLMSIAVDITERKRLEEEIRQQERLAAVGQLAAGVAHDFNNFLTTLMLYAQLGLRYPDRPVNVTRSLETILNESRKAATLVQQILDFSRRSAIEFKTTDLRPLLENVVSVLRHTLPENINLQLEVLPTVTSFMVKIDPTRFQQVVTNLATNSRDAMSVGGDLRIALDRVVVPSALTTSPENVPQGNWVRLTVSDTGSGMPPQVLEHIFEPFFTTKPPGKGTGLGLPQVHGIVAQHGGHIRVDTALARGTTFSVYFPAVSANGQAETPAVERREAAGRREKILLVEDRDELRQAACDLLENQGYHILAAANGREALRLSQMEENFDLLITDLVMPEMGGRELLHALRAVLPRLKALAITGYVIPEEERSLREEGFLDVIYKPFDMNNLTYVVRRALDTTYP